MCSDVFRRYITSIALTSRKNTNTKIEDWLERLVTIMYLLGHQVSSVGRGIAFHQIPDSIPSIGISDGCGPLVWQGVFSRSPIHIPLSSSNTEYTFPPETERTDTVPVLAYCALCQYNVYARTQNAFWTAKERKKKNRRMNLLPHGGQKKSRQ